MRHTKIVATVGPATESATALHALIEAGADVLRLNFSHGTHDQHARAIDLARTIARESGRTIALMQDLQGAKIRISSLPAGLMRLTPGSRCVITAAPEAGTPVRFATTYTRLARDVGPGQAILLDDGAMELRVVSVDAGDVTCEVLRGGVLHERKGLNLPGVRVTSPPLTPKDRADLRFGLEQGVDLVALSFVRAPGDAAIVREQMSRAGRRVPVFAKIETAPALEQLDAVLRAFDGAMVARGDLGAELPPEQVPGAQKRIIARANALGRPVITATQMLESMVRGTRPTRAEASDVANAVLDGTDAVMLSGETAIGKHPIDAVRAMDRIVRAAEALPSGEPSPVTASTRGNSAYAVCAAAAQLALAVGAHAIAAYTRSGRTAKTLSHLRPGVPVYALCEEATTARELALYRGVSTALVGPASDRDIAFAATGELVERGLVPPAASVVVVGASPGSARTDFIRLVRAPSSNGGSGGT